MPGSSQDASWMQRALELAAATAGLASPNPQVGCVLLRYPHGSTSGAPKVIGEGAHLYANRDHAEIVALKHAQSRGLDTKDATAFVTLEPCSHHGRTGPCADALISAGVRRVIIATEDPNPLVAGKGIARLRGAGVEVAVGICREQAQTLNDAFARFIRTRTPLVTLKAALSVDGKLAPPPARRLPGKPHWLTGPAARHEVQLLRHNSDAILTGVGTVLADDPALTDRSALTRRRLLLRIILDTHLRTPLTAKLVQEANGDLLIFCNTAAPTHKLTALEAAGAEVLPIPEHAGRLSLPTVLATLAERDILSLLVEGGSHLNGSFLTQNLVDKVVLFYAETELGTAAIPFTASHHSPFLLEQSLQRITRATFGPDRCVTGYLHDPWDLHSLFPAL